MRKKRFFRRVVYEYPEQLFVPERDPRKFLAWINKQRQGRELVMEIGMGTGDYLTALAKQNPDKFYLGVEIKPDRVYRGLEKARELGLSNIAFLQTHVERLQEYRLPKVHQLIMLFPDPWPKDRHHTRRMTSAGFLKLYQQVIHKDGHFFFKTDDESLFRYSVAELQKAAWTIRHLDEDHRTEEALQTAFELRFLGEGKPIYHLQALQPRQAFSLRKAFAPLIHWKPLQ